MNPEHPVDQAPTRRRFRAGDHVWHEPSKENWILAVDEENGRVRWCGWPDGEARANDCTLVQSATDEERVSMLREVAKSRSDCGTRTVRAEIARYQRHDAGLCEQPCELCELKLKSNIASAERVVIERARAVRKANSAPGDDAWASVRELIFAVEVLELLLAAPAPQSRNTNG